MSMMGSCGAREAYVRAFIFADVPVENLEPLAAASLRRHLTKDREVTPGREGMEAVSIVARGEVRFDAADRSARAITLMRLGPGSVFGFAATGECPWIDDVSAKARSDAILYDIPSVAFEHFLLEHPRVAVRLAQEQARQARTLQAALYRLATMDLDQRMAVELAGLADESPDGVIRIRRDDLAAFVGTTSDVVRQILRRLRACGYIDARPMA